MDAPGTRPRHKSETFEITIAGVLTKRADTLGELIRLREREIELEADLVALDRVLSAFGYKGDLALPGHFEIGGQPEAASAVWASHGRDEGREQPADDRLPHRRQARGRRRSR